MEKQVSEGSLHKWFKGSKSKDGKGGWVNVVTGGTCASDEPGEGTPKCVSSAKRASMTKAERLSAARRKKKADPGQQQKSGAAKPTYVSTDKPKKKKMKETYERSLTPLTEKAKKCWPGYEKKGTKKMFGKTYNNCVKKEEVILERQKDSDNQRLSQERGRSNYGKASVRNVRATGMGGNAADPAERLVAMDTRHKAHKEKRGVKTKGMKEAYSTNPAQQAAIALSKKKKKEEDMVAMKKKQKIMSSYDWRSELGVDEAYGGKGSSRQARLKSIHPPTAKAAIKNIPDDQSDRGSGNKSKKRMEKMYAGYEPQGEIIDEKNRGDQETRKKAKGYDSFIEKRPISKEEQGTRAVVGRRNVTSAMNRSGMGMAKPERETKERGERHKADRGKKTKGTKEGHSGSAYPQRSHTMDTMYPHKKKHRLSMMAKDKKSEIKRPGGRAKFYGTEKKPIPEEFQKEEAKSLFSTPALDKLKKLKDFQNNADKVFGRNTKPTDKAHYEPEGETIEEADKKGKGSGTKDACYHKVKSRYSVWPSAYASGALVKCRKVGAANWGNSSKKEDFSDWKSEFIWEDGDSSKKLEEDKSPAWQRKEGKSESGGLNAKGVASYRRENPGSKLKTAVTTKPSKLKKGSKSAKRRKSFCSRMRGMKKKLTSAKTARDPDSRINKALRKWNC